LLFLVEATLAGSVEEGLCYSGSHLEDAVPHRTTPLRDATMLQDTMALVQARLSVRRKEHKNDKGASAPSEHDAQTPEGWDWTASLKGAVHAAEDYNQNEDPQAAQPVQLDVAVAPEENFLMLPSSLQICDVVNGTGEGVSKGQRVWVHYIANLDDGTEFDNSYDGEPMEIVAGNGDVVDGFDEGVLNMRLGGKRKIIIPPSLGYGSEPPPGSPIPANANLHFTIEMMMIDPGDAEGNGMDTAAAAEPAASEPTPTPGTPEAALAKVPSKAEATERFSNAILKLYMPTAEAPAAAAAVPAAPSRVANPQQNRAEAALAKIPSKAKATAGFAKAIAKLYMPSASMQMQQAQMAPKNAQEAAAQAEMRMNPQDAAIYTLAEFRQEFLSEDMTLPEVDAWFYKHCEPVSQDLASMRFA